ncbi:MAG: multicopper oxidase domain-containing protein [Actinomycetota bacterium]
MPVSTAIHRAAPVLLPTAVRPLRRRVLGAGLSVLLVLMTGCGALPGGGGNGGAKAAPVTAPGVNELLIPELLEPTYVDGVATYDMSIGRSGHDFGTGVVAETMAYNGQSILGPTLRWNTGDEVAIRLTNDLDHVTTTHWHGADVPAEDDGGPHSRIDPGATWVADFPVIQPAATLWYHPHLMGTTAEEVFAGAAGLIIVDDDNAAAAALPNTYGVDDIPVILQDREFDADGQLAFEIDDDDNGDLNPDLTVNGTFDPYVTVPAGPVRLRLLNGSQGRVYQLSVDNDSMIKIASDGGYLPSPVAIETLTLAPGDRAEVIVDATSGSAVLLDEAFGRVLELRTDADLPTASFPPAMLATVEPITAEMIDRDRTFAMEAVGDGWGINGVQMDMMRVDQSIFFNDTERWTITVGEGVHAFHVHQTQFQILEINGEPPPPEDAGWEDTVLVTDEIEVVVAARFNTYRNPNIPYMFHCHVLDHEDLGMMGQFEVVDP